jgi:hypothetical protein
LKIYFAGSENKTHRKTLLEAGVRNILMSYYYLSKSKTSLKDIKKETTEVSVFLDSGGFVARNKGVPIDVVAYAKFCGENHKYVACCANLDTNSVEESLNNQRAIEAVVQNKSPVLPVYHPSEYVDSNHRELLERWVGDGYQYIAAGGMAGTNCKKDFLYRYLDFVFSKTIEKKVKIHGFGITDFDILKRYPFYSVDSTTWLNGAIYGEVQEFEMSSMTIKKLRSPKIESRVKSPKLKSHKLLMHYNDRVTTNIRSFLTFEKFVTCLWKQRGVKWN